MLLQQPGGMELRASDPEGFAEAMLEAHLREFERHEDQPGPVLRDPAWTDIYAQDAERIQDWEQAVASDEAVTAAWRRYGYEPVDLPFVPVSEQQGFLQQRF